MNHHFIFVIQHLQVLLDLLAPLAQQDTSQPHPLVGMQVPPLHQGIAHRPLGTPLPHRHLAQVSYTAHRES